MENKLVLVTGSFDPITVGHADIVRRAAALFDRVTVLVAQNEMKQYLFSAVERAEIAGAAFADLPNVSVDVCDGYVADYAREHDATAFVRGIRDAADVAYEQDMAARNFAYCERETVFLFAKPELHGVSSTLVREKIANGKDIASLVPQKSEEKISEFLCRKSRGNL